MKHGFLSLDTHESLLASNKLISIQMEAIAKKLEAQEVASLSFNGVVCDFWEQSHKSGACLSTSLGLSYKAKKGIHTPTITILPGQFIKIPQSKLVTKS